MCIEIGCQPFVCPVSYQLYPIIMGKLCKYFRKRSILKYKTSFLYRIRTMDDLRNMLTFYYLCLHSSQKFYTFRLT